MSDDARIDLLVERLIGHHVPGKNLSEIPEEVLTIARREAELLFKLLDELRPSDIAVLSSRQVERISAHARLRQRAESIEALKEELELLKSETSQKFEHLRSGLLWAVEVLSTRTVNFDNEV